MELTLTATPRTGARGGLPCKIALSVMVVGLLGLLALSNAMAAFGSTSGNDGTGFAAGTVSLSDHDAGKAMLSLRNAGPGSTATSYITVAYGGTLPATVRLYGETSGTGLARFLTLTVTRGSGTGTGFRPDPTDFTGDGPGVLYRGTLAGFPSTYALGIADPGAWRGSDSHVYRFRVTLTGANAVQGLTASASFRWEARNT